MLNPSGWGRGVQHEPMEKVFQANDLARGTQSILPMEKVFQANDLARD